MSGGFRRFRVAEKVAESEVITSFYLVPADGQPLWPARPGQYLTLRVPAPDGPVLKTYSLSCAVDEPRHHRISVKRESAPRAGVADGVGSCWLHDHVDAGDEIEVAAPRGVFVLDEDSARPVLLLAGGVGLTPLLAMLHRLAGTDRDVWFLHACENGAVHAMSDEVRALAVSSGGRVRAHFVYRTPLAADRESGQFDSEGLIDKALLQSLLPLDDYDVYMCGPTPFMVAMFRLLVGLGIAKERIAYEFFGKAASLEALAADRPRPSPLAGSKAPPSLANLEFLTNPEAWGVPDGLPGPRVGGVAADTGVDAVVFARSGVTAAWDGAAGSLLELAESAGLAPAFSCRSGICNTCRCTIKEGEVAYFEEPLDPPAPGQVLICCSRPVGRVVLDL